LENPSSWFFQKTLEIQLKGFLIGLKTLDLQKTLDSPLKNLYYTRYSNSVPAWWGFAIVSEQQQLQSVLNRAVRWGFYRASSQNIKQICFKTWKYQFFKILSNESYVLHQYLPP